MLKSLKKSQMEMQSTIVTICQSAAQRWLILIEHIAPAKKTASDLSNKSSYSLSGREQACTASTAMPGLDLGLKTVVYPV